MFFRLDFTFCFLSSGFSARSLPKARVFFLFSKRSLACLPPSRAPRALHRPPPPAFFSGARVDQRVTLRSRSSASSLLLLLLLFSSSSFTASVKKNFTMPPKDKQKKAQEAAKQKAKAKVRVWLSAEEEVLEDRESRRRHRSRESIDDERGDGRKKNSPLVSSLFPAHTPPNRSSRTRPLASRTRTSRARSRSESVGPRFFVFVVSSLFDRRRRRRRRRLPLPFSSTFKTLSFSKKNFSFSHSYVQQLQKSAQTGPKTGPTPEELRKQKKKQEEEQARELASLFAQSIKQPKLQPGVDPKSVVCEFYRAGQCAKGFKCKYSHDLAVERKTQKIDLFSDRRGDGGEEEEDGMEDWDQGAFFFPSLSLSSSRFSLLSPAQLPLPPFSPRRWRGTPKNPEQKTPNKKKTKKITKQKSSSPSSSRSTAPTRATPRPPRPTTAPTSSVSTSWTRSRSGSTAGSGSAPTGTRSASTGE